MSTRHANRRNNINQKTGKKNPSKQQQVCRDTGQVRPVPLELWPMILRSYDFNFLQQFRSVSKAHKEMVESNQPQHLQIFLSEKTLAALNRIKKETRKVFRLLKTITVMLPQKKPNNIENLFMMLENVFANSNLEKIYTPGLPYFSTPSESIIVRNMENFDVRYFLQCPAFLAVWLRETRKTIDCWGDILYVLEKYVQRASYCGSPEELGSILKKLLPMWKCPMDIIGLFIELGAEVHINTLAELYNSKKLPLKKFQMLIQKYKQNIIVDNNTNLSLMGLIDKKDDSNNLCHWICKYSTGYLEELLEGLRTDLNKVNVNKVNIHDVAPVFYLFTQPSPSSNAFLKLKSLGLDLNSEITRNSILSDPQFQKTDLRRFCEIHTKKKKLSLAQIIIATTNWTKIVEQYLQNDPSLLKPKNLIFWTCSRHKSLWAPSWSTNPKFQTLIDLHDVVFGRRDLASVINPQPVFMQAGKYGLYSIVKDFVLRRTGDINLKRRDQKGDTIMHLLAKTQPQDVEPHLPLKQILKFLLTRGAPDVKNGEGLSFGEILQNRSNSATSIL